MPLQTKTYIVALKKDIDYDTFWAEMEDPTSGLPHIPDRAVGIVNNQDAFTRLCEYALTDSEADRVRADPRVAGVDIPVEDRDDVVISPIAIEIQNFTKPAGSGTNYYSTGTNINWGLIRNSNPTNVYGSGNTTSLNYNYSLDGTGVDIVISDSGIQADHPEFQYIGNTTSRVQQINWASYVPALSTMGNCYQDTNGHGTNVCGIAAGKTYGWAKGAHIYSILATGPGAPSTLDAFAAIKLWHQSKNNGRPTVLNTSWAVSYPYTIFGNTYVTASTNFLGNISSVTYRGTTYTGNSNVTNYGLLIDPTSDFCVYSLANGFPEPVPSYDTALEELIASGIIAVRAAGNSSYKIDVSTGLDYNNSVSVYGTTVYYHRGYSPTAPEGIVVGNMDAITHNTTQDQKNSSSCAGPGVDVWAAGTNILSAGTSNVSATNWPNQAPYFLNNSYQQSNQTGTSQASPQIAGIAALYLQVHPTATPAQVKSWIINNATSNLYSSGNSTSYTDPTALLGGNVLVAYNPYNSANNVTITGGITLTNIQLVNN